MHARSHLNIRFGLADWHVLRLVSLAHGDLPYTSVIKILLYREARRLNVTRARPNVRMTEAHHATEPPIIDPAQVHTQDGVNSPDISDTADSNPWTTITELPKSEGQFGTGAGGNIIVTIPAMKMRKGPRRKHQQVIAGDSNEPLPVNPRDPWPTVPGVSNRVVKPDRRGRPKQSAIFKQYRKKLQHERVMAKRMKPKPAKPKTKTKAKVPTGSAKSAKLRREAFDVHSDRDWYAEGADAFIRGESDIPPPDVPDGDEEKSWVRGYLDMADSVNKWK